jgi:CTP-dependent riboflavin kinase
MVAETVNVTGPEVQKFLRDNKAEISRAITELQKDEKVLSDQSLADIEKALSDVLQTDMKAQAKEALRTLQEISVKGEQLKSGVGLGEFDARLRDIVMILRRFHLREKGGI